jgi:hypothetical protein
MPSPTELAVQAALAEIEEGCGSVARQLLAEGRDRKNVIQQKALARDYLRDRGLLFRDFSYLPVNGVEAVDHAEWLVRCARLHCEGRLRLFKARAALIAARWQRRAEFVVRQANERRRAAAVAAPFKALMSPFGVAAE